MEIVTRELALSENLKFYFTGKECKRGHVAKRYTSTYQCLTCQNENVAKWDKDHPGKKLEISKSWAANNPERMSELIKTWRYENKEQYDTKSQKWRKNNPEKTKQYNRKTKGLPEPTRPEPDKCEICGKPETKTQHGNIQALSLDHDHETLEFRGWLCYRCNTSLAAFGDNKAGIERVLNYLNGKTSI
jgi:hypothetical protein